MPRNQDGSTAAAPAPAGQRGGGEQRHPGATTAAPAHGKVVRVLYMFPGTDRKAQIRAALLGAVQTLDLEVEVHEADLVHDSDFGGLLNSEARTSYLSDIRDGRWHLLVVSPPCASFSRAVLANTRGPRPVRNATYPMGFPWLEGAPRRRADEGSAIILFCAAALQAAADARARGRWVRGVMEFPEDLGRAELGTPASPWQLDAFRKLTDCGYCSFAFLQHRFGAPAAKPSRLLTDLWSLARGGALGWPSFDAEGFYRGPLVFDSTVPAEQLVQNDGSAKELLASTGAYPPRMLAWIAEGFAVEIAASRRAAALRAGGLPGRPSDRWAGPPPSRGPPVRDEPMQESDVYIGRGSEGHRPSKWGNPWKVAKDFPAEAAVNAYRTWLGNGAHLRDELHELAGRRLRCHCPAGQPCHADAIIEVFIAEAEAEDERRERAAEPRAAGGVGEPLQLRHRGGLRGVVDGAGLCSPGRWRPQDRLLGEGKAVDQIRGLVRTTVLAWQASENERIGTEKGLRAAIFELAAGKRRQEPVPKALSTRLSDGLARIAKTHGADPMPREGDRPQKIQVRLLGAVANLLEDPDSTYPDQVAVGVRLGVGVTMPRVPDVFEKKTKWALPAEDEHETGGERWADNYASARERPHKVREQFEKEVAEGLIVKVPVAEARARWPGRLAVAALGAIQKAADKDEWRIIFDATHAVHVNHKIRVKDQVRCPTWGDVGRLLEVLGEDHPVRFALLYDVERAHRLIPIDPRDWGYLACRIPEHGREGPPDDQELLYINTCGTFGVGSASYWWARLLAVAIRVIHKALGLEAPTYHLIYVDDGLVVGLGGHFERSIAGTLLLLAAFGIPLSAKKVRGGLRMEWIGYELDLSELKIGASERRLAWARNWCAETADAEVVLIRRLREGVGRLSFLAGPIQLLRPFLGPVYAWIAACPAGACIAPPRIVRLVLKWAARLLTSGCGRPCRPGHDELGEIFRIDAKAGDGVVSIGGWVTGARPDTSTAAWFAHELRPETDAWAWQKGGEPHRVIAALELLAVLYGVMLLCEDLPRNREGSAAVVFTVGTDNQSNQGLVRKWATTSYPLCAFAMELALQLSKRGLDLDLRWRPREANAEADALTNGKFEGFDPARRVAAQDVRARLEVAPDLLDAGGAWEARLSEERSAKKLRPERRGKKGEMRLNDPW